MLRRSRSRPASSSDAGACAQSRRLPTRPRIPLEALERRSCPHSSGRPASSASPAGVTRPPCSPWRPTSPAARACRCRSRRRTASPSAARATRTTGRSASSGISASTTGSRPEFTDELDNVGPVAASALRRHGLLWPFNAHFHVPQLELARGGSLLTGAGGDEVFGPSCWARATAVLGGRVRPEPRDVLRVVLALAPPIVRERWFRTRVPEAWPWLHPEAQRALGRELAAGAAREPLRWKRRLEWIPARRYLQVGLESLGVLAGDSNVALGHPLLDAGFVAALARLARRAALYRPDVGHADALSETSFPSPCSAARGRHGSTAPPGRRTAGRSSGAGRAKGPTRSSSTPKFCARSGSGKTPIPPRSRFCSRSGSASTRRSLEPHPSRSSNRWPAASSEDRSRGRRSSQPGRAARSSRAAGSLEGSRTARCVIRRLSFSGGRYRHQLHLLAPGEEDPPAHGEWPFRLVEDEPPALARADDPERLAAPRGGARSPAAGRSSEAPRAPCPRRGSACRRTRSAAG